MMDRFYLGLYLTIGVLFFGSSLWAQEARMSDYELERKYLEVCQVDFDKFDKKKGKIDISGDIPNCFILGLLYANSKTFLRKGQKKIGASIIDQACRKNNRAACEYKQGGFFVDKGSDLIYWASIIAMGLAVLLLANTMFQEEDEYQAQEKLEDSENKESVLNHGIVLRYSQPFFRRYVVPIVNSLKNRKSIQEKYKRKLASAGLTDVLTPEDFFSFKIFLVIGFPLVFIILREFLEEDWALQWIGGVAVFGFFYPDIWVSGKIKSRQKEIIRSMPFAVDMLALSVEAGLDFMAAMTKVKEKAKPSALTYEFDKLLKEIKIGASRAESLRNMSWRIDLIQISSFCATLIAADSVGASIGPILKSLAVEIRQKKSSDIEKAGATAATKILFPMLFLIVPAVFIVVAAPVFLQLLE